MKKIEIVSTKTQSNFRPNLIKTVVSSHHSYHEIIPAFNKLFPHSKNLIIDLRTIE